jgi:hypothetical protein
MQSRFQNNLGRFLLHNQDLCNEKCAYPRRGIVGVHRLAAPLAPCGLFAYIQNTWVDEVNGTTGASKVGTAIPLVLDVGGIGSELCGCLFEI